jgi:hypothetical protein
MSKLISEALRIIDQEINAVTRKEYLATQQAKQQALDEAAADDDSEDVAPPKKKTKQDPGPPLHCSVGVSIVHARME